MKKLTILFLLVTLALGSNMAWAASPWTEETLYGDRVTGKLQFGLKNLLGGWTAIFSTPYRYHRDGKNTFVGIPVGIGEAVVYTVGGALHTATFPIPADIPLPNNGISFD